MEEIAGWVAPAATMIAAMMTAANFGARFTGWGFVVFLVGSIAWIVVALSTGQQNLLLTNAFLSLVNLIGIWRWLGRQARYADGAEAASEASRAAPTPKLFGLNGLEGRTVTDAAGETVGQVIGAMAECGSGRIAYLMLREQGTAERLHALPFDRLEIGEKAVHLKCSGAEFKALPLADATDWPTRAPDG